MRGATNWRTRRALIAMALIAVAVVVADLTIKRVVTAWLGPDTDRHAWWLVDEVLGFEYVQNSGAAFGIMRGNAELLAVLSMVVGAGFVWLLLQELGPSQWAAISGGLLIGGGAGNLVERFGDGFVTDYVAIGPWPRFNVADSAVTVAVVIFAVALLRDSRHARAEPGVIGEEQRDGQA